MSKCGQHILKDDIILLQAYLERVVSIENKCKDDFSHTEWYLLEKYSEDEIIAIINYFKENGVKCDCDVVKKFNWQC